MRIMAVARVAFGFFYLFIHVAMMAFSIVYIFMAFMVPNSGVGLEGFIFTAIAILGLLVGDWIRKGMFGARRIALMVLSVILSLALIGLAFFIPAGLKKKAVSVSPQQMMRTVDLELITSVTRNDFEDVVRALNAGANVNAQTDFGETALHLVKDKKIAQYLIDKGADVNAKNFEFEMTPIFYQDFEIAQLLLTAGAKIDIKGKKGNTPLMWYAYSNYIEGINFLLSKGANINTVNEEGSTVLDVAQRFGHRELESFLKSHGGKTAAEIKGSS